MAVHFYNLHVLQMVFLYNGMSLGTIKTDVLTRRDLQPIWSYMCHMSTTFLSCFVFAFFGRMSKATVSPMENCW